MIPTLGTFGEEMNLDIRRGATFGPFRFRMTDAEGAPIDLTGCTIRGNVRKAWNSAAATTLEVRITAPAQGEYEFGLSDAAVAPLRTGERPRSLDSRYVWSLELVDAQGRVLPLYFGQATVW